MLIAATAYANEPHTFEYVGEYTSPLTEKIGPFADTFFKNALVEYNIPGAVFIDRL